MKILIPTLLRGAFLAALLFPPASHAGLLDFLRREKQVDTSELDAQDVAAQAMFKNAAEREADGRYEAAREIHEAIVEEHPLTSVAAESQFKIGELLELEGKGSKAFDAYDEFITKFKGSTLFSKAIERQYEIARRGYEGRAESFLGIKYDTQPSRLIEMFTAVTKNAPYSKYAPLAQYAIGEIYADQDDVAEAISAYQKVVADYPSTKKAAEAQFQIGELLTASSQKGNNDQAHLRKTREAYEEFLIQFPKDELAEVAMEQLDEIESQEITKSFEIARFYEKSGNLKAAAIYYEDVLQHPSAAEYDEARARMDAIGERGDLRIGTLDLTPEVAAVPAKYDVKSRSDYLGPPAPTLASASRRSMRSSMDDLAPVPVVEPDLPESAPDMGQPTSPLQSLLPPVSSSDPAPNAPQPFETLLPPASSAPSILGTPSSPILSIEDLPLPPAPAADPAAPEEIKVIKSTAE